MGVGGPVRRAGGASGLKRLSALEHQSREEANEFPTLLPPVEDKETEFRSTECLQICRETTALIN